MNPKILPALDEIEAVLKKHDMMGLIIVADSGETNFRMRVEASWSCAKLEVQPESDGRRQVTAVRIRSKQGDFPTESERRECSSATINAFINMQKSCDTMSVNIEVLKEMLKQAGVVMEEEE